MSTSTKSMTLISTEIGSQKFLKNGTKRQKARRIFGDMKVYLLIDESITIVYIRM